MPEDQQGSLYVVATPLGHLGDLSSRAIDVLGTVDLVLCEDTRHTGRLLKAFGIRARTRSLHAHNEAARSSDVIALLTDGADAALVSDAGTPAVSDPGERLVADVVARGLRVVPIPGPSAAIAALSASGLPTGSFRFEGFLTRKSGARRTALEPLVAGTSTVILYESPRRVLDLLTDVEAVAGSERRVVVARELTKVHEEFVRGTVADVRERLAARERVLGECTVLIEGAEPSTEAPPMETGVEVRKLAAALVERGMRAKDARDVLCVVASALSKRDAYQMVLEAKREGG